MKQLSVKFQTGSSDSPTFDQIKLIPTRNGRVSYAQNINFDHPQLPSGLPTPGPSYTTYSGSPLTTYEITCSSTLFGTTGISTIYYGTKRIIPDGTQNLVVLSTSDGGITVVTEFTVSAGVSANIRVVDILAATINPSPSTVKTVFYFIFTANDGVFRIGYYDLTTFTIVKTLSDYSAELKPIGMGLGYNGQIQVYTANVIHQITLSNPNVAQSEVLVLPKTSIIRGMIQYQNLLLILASGTGGNLYAYLWDYNAPAPLRASPVPAIQILDAIVSDNNGNVIIFGHSEAGGVDTTNPEYGIYQFTGYGTNLLASYNDEPPSYVTFNSTSTRPINYGFDDVVYVDEHNMIWWMTNTGKLMRFNSQSRAIDNLVTFPGVTTPSVRNCINRMLGYAITVQYYTATGSKLALIREKESICENSNTTISSATTQLPLMISGLINLHKQSVLRMIITQLKRPIGQSATIELRKYYLDTSTNLITYTLLDTFTATPNPSEATFITRFTDFDVDNFAIGYYFNQGNATVSYPQPQAVISCTIYYKELNVR